MRKLIFFFIFLFWVCVTAKGQIQITPILIDSGLYINDIDILSQDTVLFSSRSKIYRTTNGGASWDSIETNLAGSVSVDFLNFNYGVAVNYNSIKRTTNAGVTWDSIAFVTSTNNRDCHMIDSNHFIISTDSGYIRHFFNSYFVDDTLVDPLVIGQPVVIFDFDFLDNGLGFGGGEVNGFSAVIHSTDNGLTWDVRANSGFLHLYFHEISFVDSMVGWAIQDSPGLGEHISFTTDGGYTWQSGINTIFDEKRMNGLDFSTSGLGYVLTKSGYIFETNNGGQSWDTAYTYQSGGLVGIKVKIVNDSVAYIGGIGGIYKLTNFTTSIIENSPQKNLVSVFPTPFKDNIAIQSSATKISIAIYNLFGKSVYHNENQKNESINLSFLPSGYYVLQATDGKRLQSLKLIKQ